jgi:20S proteasome subunit beta 4
MFHSASQILKITPLLLVSLGHLSIEQMEHLLGIVGDGFVLLAADQKMAHSILTVKLDQDKIMVLEKTKLLAASGEPGDVPTFTEYIQANLKLANLRNDFAHSTHAVAHFIRGELADNLRKSPYSVNLLLGGYDDGVGPSLYWIDYLGSMQQIQKGAHGYGAFFVTSIMDRYHRPNMSFDDAMKLMKMCCKEIATRFLAGSNKFTFKVVDKDGCRVLSQDEIGEI